MKNKVAVIDCITLWLTNFFVDNQFDVEITLNQTKNELDALSGKNSTLIIVSNEIGMGLHAETGQEENLLIYKAGRISILQLLQRKCF